MMNKFFDQHFMHGGDYNPDQWLDYPEILKNDLDYTKWWTTSMVEPKIS